MSSRIICCLQRAGFKKIRFEFSLNILFGTLAIFFFLLLFHQSNFSCSWPYKFNRITVKKPWNFYYRRLTRAQFFVPFNSKKVVFSLVKTSLKIVCHSYQDASVYFQFFRSNFYLRRKTLRKVPSTPLFRCNNRVYWEGGSRSFFLPRPRSKVCRAPSQKEYLRKAFSRARLHIYASRGEGKEKGSRGQRGNEGEIVF